MAHRLARPRAPRRCGATVICIAMLLVAATASAAKTDIVVLNNGDRFTGEVKRLSRGQLTLETSDVGTIYVEWDKIEYVTTAGRYELVMRDGARYLGTLAPDTPGQTQVVAEDGGVTHLARLDIVSFSPIKTGFLDRVDGSLDLGGNYTKSTGIAETSFDLDATYRAPLHAVYVNASSTLTGQSAAPFTSRFDVQAGYRRFLRDGWIVNPFVYGERNPDLGLTLRTLAALAVGRYLKQSNHSSTLLAAGAAVGRERPSGEPPSANVDALLMFTTSLYTYDFPKRSADFSLLVFPELNRPGRVRANLDAKLKRELFRDFFVALIAYDDFDNKPVAAGASRNDVGVTLSLGWGF